MKEIGPIERNGPLLEFLIAHLKFKDTEHVTELLQNGVITPVINADITALIAAEYQSRFMSEPII